GGGGGEGGGGSGRAAGGAGRGGMARASPGGERVRPGGAGGGESGTGGEPGGGEQAPQGRESWMDERFSSAWRSIVRRGGSARLWRAMGRAMRMRVGHRAWVSGRVTHTGRAAGASSKARSGTARGKRQGLACRSSECAAQVIFGIGVTTRKAGASESQYSADLVGRYAAAQQPLGDPQICNTPIGRGETLGNLQAVQAARIDANGGGGGEGGRDGRRRQRNRRASRRGGGAGGLQEKNGQGGGV